MLISGITIIGISHSYYVKNIANEVLSGTIEGTFADFRIERIYVDNTEVQSMNSVPSGYIVDTDNTYCYISTPLVHDTNASISTNSDGEIVISGFSKNEKCVVYFKKAGPTAYWFGNCSGGACAFPNYGGTLQNRGSLTRITIGYYIYIGQDNTKNYLCINYQGKTDDQELCLSQPYTQYGLEGHIQNNQFNDDQKNSAKNALYQLIHDNFDDTINISKMYVNDNVIEWNKDTMYYGISSSGSIFSTFTDGRYSTNCVLYYDGSAQCTYVSGSSG